MKLTMREFLQATKASATFNMGAPEILIGRGYHPDAIYAKALEAACKGYTNYGIAADRAWLTGLGVRFLADSG